MLLSQAAFATTGVPTMPESTQPTVYVPPEDYYDTVVVGTDPEGIAAAVSSARNGKRTLLVDTRTRVGGLFTLGGLNSLDMNYTPMPTPTLLTQGIFKEFFDALDPINATGSFWGKRDSFDVLHAEQIFMDMITQEPNITLVMDVDAIEPVVEGDRITTLKLYKHSYYRLVQGEVYIDATQDADIAAKSGVPYTIGGEDIHEPQQIQAITQVFRVENVDWTKMQQAILADKALYNAESNRYSAWGFLEQMKAYQAVYPNVKVRGLNIGLQDDGSVLINAMQMIGFDPLNPQDIAEVKRIGALEASHITDYIRTHIPGFENATYGGVTEELYIRESRHIEGEYTLTISDMMKHTDFEDKIAWGSYPVDIQTTDMNNWGYVIGDPEAYSIPFRCIVPKGIDNLLVVGRSASYHSIGFGSVRVVPIGMAVAEAAGVAAAYAVDTDMTFREMAYNSDAIRWVQQTLRNQGAFLEDLAIPYQYQGHIAEQAIDLCYELGIIIGSYNNDLKLTQVVSGSTFKESLDKLTVRSGLAFGERYEVTALDAPITPQQAVDTVWEYFGIPYALNDRLYYFSEQGIIPRNLATQMRQSEWMTYEMMYRFVEGLHSYTVKQNQLEAERISQAISATETDSLENTDL